MYRYEWGIPGIFCPDGWADPQLAPQEDDPASSGDQLEDHIGSDQQYYNFLRYFRYATIYNIYKTVKTWWCILLDTNMSKAKLRLTASYCIWLLRIGGLFTNKLPDLWSTVCRQKTPLPYIYKSQFSLDIQDTQKWKVKENFINDDFFYLGDWRLFLKLKSPLWK